MKHFRHNCEIDIAPSVTFRFLEYQNVKRLILTLVCKDKLFRMKNSLDFRALESDLSRLRTSDLLVVEVASNFSVFKLE